MSEDVRPGEAEFFRKHRADPGGPLRARLAEGQKAEDAGVLERADALYQEVIEQATDPDLLAEALLRRSHVHRSWGMSAEAIRLAQQGRALARQAGIAALEAELLNAEAGVHQVRGDLDAADELLHSMLTLTEDPRVRGIALQNLAAGAARRQDFPEAERLFRESSSLFEVAGYRRGEAFALINQGRVLLDMGFPEASRPVFERAAMLAGELQDLYLHALSRLNLAEALLAIGVLDEAEDRAAQSMGYFTASENPLGAVECLRIQGDISVRRDDAAQAARCYQRALKLAEELGAKDEVAALEERLASLPRTAE